MIRSARLRFPSNINLLVKRATLRLLYFASGTSGRRTTLLRLGTFCLLRYVIRAPEKASIRLSDLSLNLFRTPTRGCLSSFLCSHTPLRERANQENTRRSPQITF